MSGQKLEEFLAGCDLDQIKNIIFTLVTQYFPYMEDTQRQELILKLLGESGPDKLSSMVYRWIAECMDEGVDPKNLSRRMVTAMDEYAQIESLSNPEIRSLFIDWMEELEKEILDFYKKGKKDAPDELAGQFGISRKSADFLINKMKQEGKIE